MSELKAIRSGEIYNIIEYEDCYRTDDLYYPKSEADKVIAELKRQIEFLKVTTDSCKNCAQCADGMGKVFDKEFNPLKDKLRREKYKRCLAMARWCEDETEINHNSAYEASEYLPSREDYFRRREEHYEMWRKRWLKLAEQFKPNNSTAQ